MYIAPVWTIKAPLLLEKETFKCKSNMKPGRRESDQSPDRLVSWTFEKQNTIVRYYNRTTVIQTDIRSFHIDRHLPAECPAKPLSFFFSDSFCSGSSE